jgi:hypothetical protein
MRGQMCCTRTNRRHRRNGQDGEAMDPAMVGKR